MRNRFIVFIFFKSCTFCNYQEIFQNFLFKQIKGTMKKKKHCPLSMQKHIRILFFNNSTEKLSLLFQLQPGFQLKFRKRVYSSKQLFAWARESTYYESTLYESIFSTYSVQSTFSNHVHFRFWLLKAAQGFQNVRDIFQACETTHWQWEVPKGITTQRFQQRNVPS